MSPIGHLRTQSCFPVAASNPYRPIVLSSIIADVKTRPAATTGQPIPSPSFSDQRTFFSVENSTGNGFDDSAMPPLLGPRNCGQSSATDSETGRITNVAATMSRNMTISVNRTQSTNIRRQTSRDATRPFRPASRSSGMATPADLRC